VKDATIKKALKAIAKKHLGIDLYPKKSNCCSWTFELEEQEIEKALRAAYDAGAQQVVDELNLDES